MSRFLETIQISEGQITNLTWHNLRLNKTIASHYQGSNSIDLSKKIFIPLSHSQGTVKCRVLYDREIERIEFLSYHRKEIKSLQIVHDNNIIYSFKSTNRTALDHLYSQRKEADDILIIKNGLITDTWYCNVALSKNNEWFTPTAPLLYGTRRASLLESGMIKTKEILEQELKEYDQIMLFNSMIGIGEMVIPISSIAY